MKIEDSNPLIYMAKLGQDGHDRGIKVLASAFADFGWCFGPLLNQWPAPAPAPRCAAAAQQLRSVLWLLHRVQRHDRSDTPLIAVTLHQAVIRLSQFASRAKINS